MSAQGCSSLRRNQRDASVAEARQFSLRGADALQLKKNTDAETLFAEALRRCPADERAHWGMAEVQWQKGNCQQAADHLQQAVKLSGNNPDLLVRLGEMHLQAGRPEEALKQADLALASNRQHAGAWQLRGRVAEHHQQWQQAIDCYQRALMAKPNNPPVQLAVAEVYQRLGKPQRSLATLERMSDAQSAEYQSAAAWMLKGQALASLGQSDAAKLCWREAASRAGTQDFQLFLNMADIHAQRGELAEARVALGRALNLQPDHQQARQLKDRLEQQFSTIVAGQLPPSPPATTGIISVSGPLSPPQINFGQPAGGQSPPSTDSRD
ncbi:MAG: tetratricopeptide repeat protein [Pirellulaceae bacterium]|nr:tetratricopeptide repeat protein [Pirellulaceae bacterium]